MYLSSLKSVISLLIICSNTRMASDHERYFTDDTRLMWHMLQKEIEFWCKQYACSHHPHYNNVIKTTMASQITSITVVYSTVYSDVDQRKHQSSASQASVWGIHATGEFPAQRASYSENVPIWWRHHVSVFSVSYWCHTRNLTFKKESSFTNIMLVFLWQVR